MAPFYGWGSTASKLQPLQGGSLLVTIQFPEIPGTHFMDLRRMKGWVDLGDSVVLNTGLLDWESSALTTRLLLQSQIIEKLIHNHLTVFLNKHNYYTKGSLVFNIITQFFKLIMETPKQSRSNWHKTSIEVKSFKQKVKKFHLLRNYSRVRHFLIFLGPV